MKPVLESLSKLSFITNEDGAVTVDWVVLTAAIVGLGMAVVIPIATATSNNANSISSYLNNVQVGYTANATS